MHLAVFDILTASRVCERGLSLPCSLGEPYCLRDKAFKSGHMEANELVSWVLGLGRSSYLERQGDSAKPLGPFSKVKGTF